MLLYSVSVAHRKVSDWSVLCIRVTEERFGKRWSSHSTVFQLVQSRSQLWILFLSIIKNFLVGASIICSSSEPTSKNVGRWRYPADTSLRVGRIATRLPHGCLHLHVTRRITVNSKTLAIRMYISWYNQGQISNILIFKVAKTLEDVVDLTG